MTARFAGSRSIDERRRRRLSQESSEEAPIAETPRRRRSPAAKATEAPIETGEILRAPDESLIPRSSRRITLLALCGLACWGLVLWLGLTAWPGEVGLGPAVNLRSGGLPAFYSTACLFIAAQFASVILWYRSRCRKDFMGRYRVWAWIAALWLVMSLCNATGIHVPVTRLLIDRYPLGCWRPDVLYWLAPVAVGVLACHQLILREVRQSRLSSWFMHASFGIGCMAGVIHLAGDLWIGEPARQSVTTAVTMFWHLSITVATLVHARFVVHVTSEAPPKRARRPFRIPRRVSAWGTKVATGCRSLAQLFRRTPQETEAEEDATDKPKRRSRPKKSVAKTSAKSKPRTSVSKGTKPPAAIRNEEDEESETDDEPVKSVAKSPPPPPTPVSPPLPAAPVKATPAPPTVAKPIPAPTEKPAPAGVSKPASPGAKPTPSPLPGKTLRADAPSPVPTPHVPVTAVLKDQAADETSGSGDDDDEDDGFDSLSKKERRRLKKQQRQRTRE